MQWTWWMGAGAIFGGLGVALGAFGAHALKARLTTQDLEIFETGVRYQMYHAFALLALGFLAMRVETGAVKTAGFAFIFGTIIFSGSLYVLVLTGQRWLGAVTPIGGTAMLIGWSAFAWAALRPSM